MFLFSEPQLKFEIFRDQTHTNKCLNNFFAGRKVYLGLKQESRVCILGN
jgi:hypothetical protein